MTIKLHSHSPADTFLIGETIGQQLKGDEIIFLKGELGAGKTLLTKGIASALGIKPEEVVSPSFTLINEFRGQRKRNGFNDNDYNTSETYRLYHVDLYRLGPSIENNLPEIDDYIGEGVIVVEWAQFLGTAYLKLNRMIKITLLLSEENENTRILEINTKLKIKIPS
ncbi:MAG: tRNA (adenosine(37)-N6)-threonylcarbamoyltransferase complex ATPase subunit type 1 TsaE [Candidatus Aminicenantes bacterium]|jgi:tRNA threonylcarbamoyladenosine biosynthesis protein TsaE